MVGGLVHVARNDSKIKGDTGFVRRVGLVVVRQSISVEAQNLARNHVGDVSKVALVFGSFYKESIV